MTRGRVQGLQVMRWDITHRPQDLLRSKHTLAEGETLEEEDMPLPTDDFIGVYAKPESCKGTIDVGLACRINGLSELGSSTREIL